MYRAKRDFWYLERIIWLMAGIFVLVSSILSIFHSRYWLILTMLVGVNMLILAFTGFCPMANLLKALGARPLLEKEK